MCILNRQAGRRLPWPGGPARLWPVLASCTALCLLAVPAARPQAASIATDIVRITVEQQWASVRPGSHSALAIDLSLAEGWHFYASEANAPAGMNLKLRPAAGPDVRFAAPIFPASERYFDPSSGNMVDVFSGSFRVLLPFEVAAGAHREGREAVTIAVEGAVCSDVQCRVPDFGSLAVEIQINAAAPMDRPAFELPSPQKQVPSPSPAPSAPWLAFGLALIAGLTLNIMPCVWPVVPIIVMRIVEQSKAGGRRSTTMGLVFCSGILGFFACLAAANIILRLAFGTVLQWGDQFRHPIFLGAMAVLLVIMAMFSFGVLSLNLPSSIGGGGKRSASGLAASAGMGFLAAILSTPCSFAILAAAFAWAQAQPPAFATLAIMTIGLGMAAPYGLLTAAPGLLKRLPRPGRWTELFKRSVGFVMLLVAVKLVSALPQAKRMSMVYFAVILGFCVWMWGGWVDLNTKAWRKWAVRAIAVALAAAAGWAFLGPAAKPAIDWQAYSGTVVEAALKEGRPVLIDFSADWCFNCAIVERTVYSRRDIAALIKEKNVLPIKADTTQKDFPATAALRDVYAEPGVPVTILHVPGEQEPVRWRGLSFGDGLASALRKLPGR